MVCSSSHRGQRRGRCRPRPTRRRRSTPAPSSTGVSSIAVLHLAGRRVAVLEQRVVDVDELVGLRVTDGHRRLQGEEAGVLLGLAPRRRRLALFDVGLAERERQERDVPVGAGPQAGDHVIVDDAGAWAAVVVGQAEGARSCGHTTINRRAPAPYSRPATAILPERRGRAPAAMPATTSDGVVDAHVGPAHGHRSTPAVHHSGADRSPSHDVSRSPAKNAAALACPRRERRGQRRPDRVARIALGGRSGALEQPLERPG